jgi:hypothetical protein
VGVDRLSASFTVVDYDLSAERWQRSGVVGAGGHGQKITYGSTLKMPSGQQCFVGVQERWDAGEDGRQRVVTGKVEMNPSRVVDPDGWTLHGHEAIAPALLLAAELVEQRCSPTAPATEWKCKRIDVARDFTDVDDIAGLLDALAAVHRPYAKVAARHAAPGQGTQTLSVGSKAGKVRVYDKHAETEGKAAPGTLRWETEARTDWLAAYGGMEEVGSITPGALETLANNRWEWSAMGIEVQTRQALMAKVVAYEAFTDREGAMFVGWLMMRGAGFTSVTGSTTLAKFRRAERALGVTAADVASLGTSTVRLDWDSGRLMHVA